MRWGKWANTPAESKEEANRTFERYINNDDPKVQKQFIAQMLREFRKDRGGIGDVYSVDPAKTEKLWNRTIKYLSDKLQEWGMSEYESMEHSPIERGEMRHYIDERFAIKNLVNKLAQSSSVWRFMHKKQKEEEDSHKELPKDSLEGLLQSDRGGAKDYFRSIS